MMEFVDRNLPWLVAVTGWLSGFFIGVTVGIQCW